MKKTPLLFIGCAVLMGLAACSDDNNTAAVIQPSDDIFVGQPVGNFTAAEWYPGGELGTTDNVSSSSYEDETPAVTLMGKSGNFKSGELFFERNFVETLTQSTPFRGLGPAWVRTSCIQCHPGYGHGKRVNSYEANSTIGNGYLLVIYHPTAGVDATGKAYAKDSYVTEVTGMPQTKAASPFLPPVDESGISIAWLKATDGALPTTFPDGETYELIYPEVTIAPEAFNTNPRPTNYEVRLESTIGIYGTGLLDAISEDDLKAQYQAEAPYVSLNPAMWDAAANDWAATAYYSLADGKWADGSAANGVKAIKRYTYALTRASLQDGAGANAIWNITNVTRGDRTKLYTTQAWANAMAENAEVIDKISQDPSSPYYADGTREGIAEAVRGLLSPTTDQTNNAWHNFTAEMNDQSYYDFMVWHRGLAVPRARDLNSADVQRGKEVFYEIGCTACHRPSWTTGDDNYWTSNNVAAIGKLPQYPNQKIWPYTDMIQHRLFMKNDIRTGWCRTTPLWGRGLSLSNTGAEDRLHDCRARNEIEAIMWHGYSRESDAFASTEKFFNLPKADRDAVVAFLRAI
ncbi:MAG: di-heme oxidoredictase family protein [Alloprevotella sp.]